MFVRGGVAGAVGRHLRERGDAIDELRVLVPFNLHSLEQPLPAAPGNPFAYVPLVPPIEMRRLHAALVALALTAPGTQAATRQTQTASAARSLPPGA